MGQYDTDWVSSNLRTCDKIIHDLSQYDVTEVQKLLQDEPDSCVRASVDAFGVVATKPERDGSIR